MSEGPAIYRVVWFSNAAYTYANRKRFFLEFYEIADALEMARQKSKEVSTEVSVIACTERKTSYAVGRTYHWIEIFRKGLTLDEYWKLQKEIHSDDHDARRNRPPFHNRSGKRVQRSLAAPVTHA